METFQTEEACGVHVYLGGGRTLQLRHSPMFGAGHDR